MCHDGQKVKRIIASSKCNQKAVNYGKNKNQCVKLAVIAQITNNFVETSCSIYDEL